MRRASSSVRMQHALDSNAPDERSPPGTSTASAPARRSCRNSSTASSPTSLCLQEIKASLDQLPVVALRHRGLLVLLARRQGLLGRRPARAQGDAAPSARRSPIPPFDFEQRIVDGAGCRRRPWRRSTCRTAARTSPRRCASSRRWTRTPRSSQRGRPAAGPVRRPERRAHRHGRPSEGAQAARDRPARRKSARCSSASSAHGLVDVHRTLDPDNADLFTWWAPWRNMRQRNIGWRLDYVLAASSRPGALVRRAARVRHQRSRPRHRRLRRHRAGGQVSRWAGGASGTSRQAEVFYQPTCSRMPFRRARR